MIKFRLYFDKDSEEEFLNKMAAKGYAMTRFFIGFYWFEECEPGEYTYRIDIIGEKSTREKNEYYDLIRDSGGEFVQAWGVWAFFRRKGKFELYSDNESKINHYNRVKKAFLLCAILYIIMAVYGSILYFKSNHTTIIPFIYIIILGIITFAFQIYKCDKKIKSLKKE